MRKLCAILTILWTLASRTGWPAETRPTMRVVVGPIGDKSLSLVIPVAVLVRNPGPAREARLEAVWTEVDPPLVAASLSLDLPARSRRVVRFYLNRFLSRVSLQVVLRCDGQRAACAAFRLPEKPDLGVALHSQRILLPQGQRLTRLPDWALPVSHIAYRSLRGIAIGDAPLSALSLAQQDAIVQYVYHGGTLLISAGARGPARLKSFLGRLLPGARCRVRPLAPEIAFARSPVAAANVRRAVPCAELSGPGLTPLVARGGVVEVAARSAGRGWVVWSGVDVMNVSLLGTGPLQSMIGSLSSFKQTGWRRSQGAADALAHIPSDPPPFVWVIVFGAAYVLALGPGAFWLMRRTGAPMIAWPVLTAIGLAFTALLPLLSALIRSAPSDLFTASLVECFPGKEKARFRLIGLLACRGWETHRLAVEGVRGSAAVDLRQERVRVIRSKPSEDRIVMERVHAPMGSTRALEVEGLCDAPDIGGWCERLPGGGVKATIVNRVAADLPRGALLHLQRDGKWISAGTSRIPAGATRCFTVAPRRFDTPDVFWLPPKARERFSLDVGAALVLGDPFNDAWPPQAYRENLYDRISQLTFLPWPRLRTHWFLRQKVDVRTLIVWLPWRRTRR